MKRKCYLHIGTHKTGTTSVQSFLYQNRNVLKEKSIFYPAIIENETDAGHHSIAATIAKNNNYDSLKKEPQIENLLQQIKSSNYETTILSSEIFSTISPSLVKKVFAEFDCKVICFLRRQDEFIESMYRELIKNSNCTYFFDTKNRKQIMAMVADSNEALAKTYLKDSKASWLKKDFSIEDKYTMSQLENDTLFQCMSLLIAHQANRINHQTKQILKLQQEVTKIQKSLDILRK